MITKEKVLDCQKRWGEGIINIGKTFDQAGDYKKEAIAFIKDLYAYETENVLFKPTLAADIQFRLDKDAALSYFIGGNSSFSEDKGFAIKSWSDVKWENAGVKIIDDIAVCMGNYFFIAHNQEDLKVEYTMVFKSISGSLKIILHDSHLPYHK